MNSTLLSPLNGFIVVNKPRGPSSASVTNHAKWLLKQQGYPKGIKIGHGGTLDPLAEGLLPIGLGKATKQLQMLLDGPKTYLFTIHFGTATTTGDAEGAPTGTAILPTLQAVQAVLPQFTGSIQQVPPAFSALKVGGRRAYQLARQGQDVQLAPRTVTIHSLVLMESQPTPHSPILNPLTEATFQATVSKGTYIRTLAADIAKAAGSAGHTTLLRRTGHGPFRLEHALTPEQLDNLIVSGQLASHLLPLLAVPPAE